MQKLSRKLQNTFCGSFSTTIRNSQTAAHIFYGKVLAEVQSKYLNNGCGKRWKTDSCKKFKLNSVNLIPMFALVRFKFLIINASTLQRCSSAARREL